MSDNFYDLSIAAARAEEAVLAELRAEVSRLKAELEGPWNLLLECEGALSVLLHRSTHGLIPQSDFIWASKIWRRAHEMIHPEKPIYAPAPPGTKEETTAK